MIKIYNNGKDFYNDNKNFLLASPYTEVFFRLDSIYLLETNKKEYAIKAYSNNKALVCLKKEPYSTLFFGDIELVEEMLTFMINNGYEIYNYLCPTLLGDELMNGFNNKEYCFDKGLSMDFMEAKNKYIGKTESVEKAREEDVDEIYSLTLSFIKDCNLDDVVIKDNIRKSIDNYRIIRIDNKIVSMAKMVNNTEKDMKLTYVYTKDEYRGYGYAKNICGSIVNEIIDMGKIATLNVDQNNPISNHVYSKIGFKKVFSQAVYVLKK